MFSYAPEQEDELGLEVGDIVSFIGEVEEGWWRGQIRERTGIFPSNFVQELEPTAGNMDGTNGTGPGEPPQSEQSKKDSNRTTFLVKGSSSA